MTTCPGVQPINIPQAAVIADAVAARLANVQLTDMLDSNTVWLSRCPRADIADLSAISLPGSRLVILPKGAASLGLTQIQHVCSIPLDYERAPCSELVQEMKTADRTVYVHAKDGEHAQAESLRICTVSARIEFQVRGQKHFHMQFAPTSLERFLPNPLCDEALRSTMATLLTQHELYICLYAVSELEITGFLICTSSDDFRALQQNHAVCSATAIEAQSFAKESPDEPLLIRRGKKRISPS